MEKLFDYNNKASWMNFIHWYTVNAHGYMYSLDGIIQSLHSNQGIEGDDTSVFLRYTVCNKGLSDKVTIKYYTLIRLNHFERD